MEPGPMRPEALFLPPSPSTLAVHEATDHATRSEQAPSEDTESASHDDEYSEGALPAATDCGCHSPTKGHLDDLKKFQDNINGALQKLPRAQVQYDRVRVLVVYWDKSDVRELPENAEKLKTLFERDYGFEVDSHVLENGDAQSDTKIHNILVRKRFRKKLTETYDLIDKITSVADEEKEVNNLLILYYGGHGANLKTTGKPETVWQPTRQSETMLEWQRLQQELREIDCDVLFLFDCCYALDMIDTEKPWKRRCEILGSSGASDKAPAKPESSFTRAIIEELAKPQRINPKGMDVRWLHTLMTSSKMAKAYNLSPSPQWRRCSGPSYQTSILLESKMLAAKADMTNRNDTDAAISVTESITKSVQELSSLIDTRILIKIQIANPAETLLVEDWMKWFQHRPSNITAGGH